jgi:transposase InsO family protein
VLAVLAGATVTEIVASLGVSRQTVSGWKSRYAASGLAGLADRSRRPASCPHQASAEVETAVCELRRKHPRWGPRRIAHALERSGAVSPLPSRMTVYRILVRHGLVEPGVRRRKRSDYKRWQRDRPMQLWQMDIVGGVMLVDTVTGELTEAKVVTGVDDHSRFCVIASVVERATGRAVCAAFAGALRRFGVPEEVLTDNGKQFTDRFGHGGEVLFDRICRENGIAHRLTQPASPTTTGKVERFHQTLRRELLDDCGAFESIEAAQAALDRWVQEYNSMRPHQALGMQSPGDRFTPVPEEERDVLGLKIPGVLALVPQQRTPPAAPGPGISSLKIHKERQQEERQEAGKSWTDNGLVFTTPNGQPLDPTNLTRRFRRLLHSAGLRTIRFHDLRHSTATLLLEQGVDLVVIKELLGHAHIGVTAGVYAHVRLCLQRQAINTLGAALGPTGDGPDAPPAATDVR